MCCFSSGRQRQSSADKPMCDSTFSLALSWHDYYDELSMRQREILCLCVITSLATYEMITTVDWASFRLPRGLKIAMQSPKYEKWVWSRHDLLVHLNDRSTDLSVWAASQARRDEANHFRCAFMTQYRNGQLPLIAQQTRKHNFSTDSDSTDWLNCSFRALIKLAAELIIFRFILSANGSVFHPFPSNGDTYRHTFIIGNVQPSFTIDVWRCIFFDRFSISRVYFFRGSCIWFDCV